MERKNASSIVDQESTMEKSSNSLAKELERVRGKTSLVDFAAKVGVHKNTLINYEKGKRMPDIEFLVNVSNATGTSFARLLALRLRSSDLEKAREMADLVAFYGDSKRGLQERAGKYHGSLERLRGATDLTVKILDGVGDVPDSVAHQLQEFLFHYNVQEQDIGWLRALLEELKR